MIHLESLIQAQKMSFFKRYVDPEYVADWKLVLDTLLKKVGGPYLLKCSFSLSDLPIKVSCFCDGCLTLWSKFNSTMPVQVEDVLNEIVWNNKNILVNKKSCYYLDFVEASMHRICDTIKADGSFYTWSDLQLKDLQYKNFLFWHGLIDAIPVMEKRVESQDDPTYSTFGPPRVCVGVNLCSSLCIRNEHQKIV